MKLALIVALGLVAVGCASEPEPEPPAEVVTTRVASMLQRKLPSAIAVPTDSVIGGSIDALVEERTAALELTPRQPVVKLGPNGERCFEQSFDDAEGKEIMRREKCRGDAVRIGTLSYSAGTSGKIDHVADRGKKAFELFDEDGDGKVDRLIESAEHLVPAVNLVDFAPDVTILDGGKVATRERVDRDHDGRFELETITATTSFRIRSTVAPAP
ncbi:MAG: hypothetical protein KF819_25770 [Labilithrix sp.]|nr:hypothetical protein [Labilithrix sp.]